MSQKSASKSPMNYPRYMYLSQCKIQVNSMKTLSKYFTCILETGNKAKYCKEFQMLGSYENNNPVNLDI